MPAFPRFFSTASLAFLVAVAAQLQAADKPFLIDPHQTLKPSLHNGTAGANLCWLLDSDLKSPHSTSMAQAIEQLGAGSLRFPYGHLADNYLWHTPPYENASSGLRPKVAALTQIPAKWQWAVDSNGSFKSAMDFDEYMALCQKLGIAPLMVVNVLSHKYPGGPSYAALKQSAVEWVKYARQKQLKNSYWQLGNEVDHATNAKILNREEYIKQFIDFSRTMKLADPSIKVGPGIHHDAEYFRAIVSQAPDAIDFTACHQYIFSYKETTDYAVWKEQRDSYIPSVERMQKAVAQSSKPSMEILVTETAAYPGTPKMGMLNNTFKALWWFEILMNETCLKNVAYTYNWGTHNPWNGPVDDDNRDVGVLFRVDNNERKPTGEIIRLVNTHLLDRMVAIAPHSQGHIRAYATANASGSKVNIFLLNKSDAPEPVTLRLGDSHAREFQCVSYGGKSPEDSAPTSTDLPPAQTTGLPLSLQLPPLSVTLLTQTNPR